MTERRAEPPAELLPVRESRWDAQRGARALAGVQRRVERARSARRAGIVLAAAACALALHAWWPALSPTGPAVVATRTPSPAREPSVRTVRFVDGSHVELLDDSAEVEVVQVSRERVEVALRRGRGHFVVAPQPQRTFVVRVASLSLEVLGTSFTVQRTAERVHVSVAEGRVLVTSPTEKRVLVAQEAAWFSTAEAAVEMVERDSAEQASQAKSARARFLEHARQRRYARAMEVIRRKPEIVRDRPEELMLAADAARLSGDVAAAVPYLRRVAERHGHDARAPLAAFTLGRIFLFDLKQPEKAQAAFALTRKLSAAGPLAEDALAREIEAAVRAGRNDQARMLAREYLTKYPEGRRRAQMAPLVGPQ